jgi:hypothetical protein
MTPAEAEMIFHALHECLESTRRLQAALADALRTLVPAPTRVVRRERPLPKVVAFLEARGNLPATFGEIVRGTRCGKKAVQNLLHGYGKKRFRKQTFTDARPNLYSLADDPEPEL